MRIRRPRQKSEEEQILPLVNIVFLLLIFLMLAGRLAASDPLGIVPPESSSDALATMQEIVVFAAMDGRLALNGETIEESDLKTAVEKRMKTASTGELYLRADGRAQAKWIVTIIEKLKEAGVKKLRLLTVPVER